MRGFLAFLVFLPLLVFGGILAWVVRSQPKEASAQALVPPLGHPPKSDDPMVLKGWETYTTKGCVFCHGPSGEGGVANRNAQGGKVPPLNKVYEGFSEGELKTKILEGVPESAKEDPSGPVPPLYMPAWKGNLTEEELNALVKYLFSFKPAGAGEEW